MKEIASNHLSPYMLPSFFSSGKVHIQKTQTLIPSLSSSSLFVPTLCLVVITTMISLLAPFVFVLFFEFEVKDEIRI